MSGYSTQFLDGLVIDHANNVTPWTPPAVLYLALTTVVLTRADVVIPSGAEMVGLGYTRPLVANNSTFWNAATLDPGTGYKTATNKAAITLANATGDWPALPGWNFVDAPIAGNVFYAGFFDQQIGSVANGQTPLVDIGAIRRIVRGA